jgi:hypothetical protein
MIEDLKSKGYQIIEGDGVDLCIPPKANYGPGIKMPKVVDMVSDVKNPSRYVMKPDFPDMSNVL